MTLGWMVAGFAAVIVLLVWLLGRARPAAYASGFGGDDTYLCVAEKQKNGSVIRFATYNIYGGRDSTGRDNLERVASDLGGADVIALQEVRDSWTCPGQLRRVAATLRLSLLDAPTRRAWFRTQRGNALLSRVPIRRWVRKPLPHQEGRHKHFRNVTLCELEHDQRLVVIFTHVNTRKGRRNVGGQEQQLREVLALFFSHSPAVLMGDFNARRDHPLIQEALNRPDVVDAIGGYVHADDPRRKDWILSRGMEVMAAGCIDSGASNHPMYWCDARVADDTDGTESAAATGSPETLVMHSAFQQRSSGRPWQPWSRVGIRNWLIGIGLAATATAGTSSLGWIAAGILPLMAGAALIFSARSHLRTDETLTTSGPYRWIRHPCYVGNALLDLGVVLMSGWWLLIALAPIWWILVYAPVIRREDRQLLDLFGDEFQRYRAWVPALIPNGRPWSSADAGVDGHARRQQIGRLLRFINYPLVFVAAWIFHARGLDVVVQENVMETLLLTTIVGLAMGAAVANRHFVDERVVLPAILQTFEIRLTLLATVMLAGVIHAAVETDFYTWTHWLPGLALLPVSAAAAFRMRDRFYMAEALLAISIALLMEIEWLAPLLIPLYVGLALDAPRLQKRHGPISPLPQRAYLASMATGLVLAVFIELLVTG